MMDGYEPHCAHNWFKWFWIDATQLPICYAPLRCDQVLWLPNDRSKAIAKKKRRKKRRIFQRKNFFFIIEFVIGQCIQWFCTLHILIINYLWWMMNDADHLLQKIKVNDFNLIYQCHTRTHNKIDTIFALIGFQTNIHIMYIDL